MAATLVYNFSKIEKRFNVYEKTQANFAGKKALTRLGKELKNSLMFMKDRKQNLQAKKL